MLNRIQLFKTRRPKPFSFQPRYYDADKADLKARVAQIKAEMNNENKEDEGSTPALRRGSFRDAKRQSVRSAAHTQSNRRILIIAAILALAAYLWLML